MNIQSQQLEIAAFLLDAYEDEQFEGYTRGEMWNGFECPYFPFESALRIVEVLRTNQMAYYDEAADQFVFAEEDNEDDPDRFDAIQVEGIGKLYPIGAYVWTWSRAQ